MDCLAANGFEDSFFELFARPCIHELILVVLPSVRVENGSV